MGDCLDVLGGIVVLIAGEVFGATKLSLILILIIIVVILFGVRVVVVLFFLFRIAGLSISIVVVTILIEPASLPTILENVIRSFNGEA